MNIINLKSEQTPFKKSPNKTPQLSKNLIAPRQTVKLVWQLIARKEEDE
jgi:hypothetical protein